MINPQVIEHSLNEEYAKATFATADVPNTYYTVIRLIACRDNKHKADYTAYINVAEWDNTQECVKRLKRSIDAYFAGNSKQGYIGYVTVWGRKYTDANGDSNCWGYNDIDNRCNCNLNTEAKLLAAVNKDYAYYNTVRETATYWRDRHYITDADVADTTQTVLDALDNHLVVTQAYADLCHLAVTVDNIRSCIDDEDIKQDWDVVVDCSAVKFMHKRGPEEIDVQYIRGIKHHYKAPFGGKPWEDVEYKSLTSYDVAKRFTDALKTFPVNNEVKVEVTMWEEDDGAPKIRRYTQEQLDNFKFCDSLI